MLENKTDSAMREKRGKRAGLVGILVNLVLALGKMAVGSLFGVLSLTADGLNNLTDCGSSAISVLSFKLSSKPADREHPYGHERTEYVFSLGVAFLVLLFAFETGKEAVGKIVTPTALQFSLWVIAVAVVSILAKCGLYFYYRREAKAIDSDILKAAALDCLGDCISTGIVLICCIVGKLTSLNIDGYAGILVALFVARAGIEILRETFSKLIGQAPPPELVAELEAHICAYPGVLGIHDLAVYAYGPKKYFASVHVEVDAAVPVLTSHELVDTIERELIERTGILLTGHLDPIVTSDERTNSLRAYMMAWVKEIDPHFSIHDFRMVPGEARTNVLFDIAIPFDASVEEEELRARAAAAVVALDPSYCPIVTVEHTIL